MEYIFKVLSIKKVKQDNLHGFTLIELLVVIGVLGILAVGLTAAINPIGQLQKARDSKRMEDLKQIRTVLELYYDDHGRYPAASSNLIFDADTSRQIPWGTNWSPYITTLPRDSNKTYIYFADPSGQIFALYASFDRNENTCTGNRATPCTNVGSRLSGTSICGGVCNYGVTSLNTSP